MFPNQVAIVYDDAFLEEGGDDEVLIQWLMLFWVGLLFKVPASNGRWMEEYVIYLVNCPPW